MDVKDRVIATLTLAVEAGEHITFRELVKRVAEPGECLNCLQSQVRKAINKLEDEGLVTLGVVDGL